jgi:hypothetical protein
MENKQKKCRVFISTLNLETLFIRGMMEKQNKINKNGDKMDNEVL